MNVYRRIKQIQQIRNVFNAKLEIAKFAMITLLQTQLITLYQLNVLTANYVQNANLHISYQPTGMGVWHVLSLAVRFAKTMLRILNSVGNAYSR